MPPLEVLVIYAGIVAFVIAAWETTKSLRRTYLARDYVWITFDTPTQARIAADDVAKFHLDSDLSYYVDMGVSWSPGGIGLDSSDPRIMVRVPKALLHDFSVKMTKDDYQKHIKERAAK